MKHTLLAAIFATALLSGLPGSAQAEGRRIAVLYFDNTGNPELEMLRLGLAEMLISDLTGRPGLEVVERGRINDLFGELDLQKTDRVDPNTAVEMGRVLGVERVVVGSYFELMGQFQLMGRVIEVETGLVLGASEQSGAVSDFMKLEDRLADDLTPFLSSGSSGDPGEGGAGGASSSPEDDDTKALASGLASSSTEPPDRRRGTPEEPRSESASSSDPGDEEDELAAAEPSSSDADPLGAALAFSEGLDYLDRKDLTRARDSLRRAIELDPSLDAARDELAGIDI